MRRSRLGGGLRALAAAVIVLALVEGLARWLAPRPELGILVHSPILALYPGVERPGEIFSSLGHGQLEWSPYVHWVTRPHLQTRFFRTNALGFRGREVALPKPAGRYRIAIMGGSAAWGLGSTADERTVAGRLEARLRAARPDLDVEVVNAGQAGFVSGQELIHFHRAVAPLQPDLVLLFDGYNDVEADIANPLTDWPQNAAHLKARYEDFLRSGRLGADLARALRGSRALELAEGWLPRRPAGPWLPVVSAENTAASYTRNAAALARLAAPAPVWVALQPALAATAKPPSREEERMLAGKEAQVQGYAARVRAAYGAMEREAERAGLPVIRLEAALGTEPVLLFADECHFGDEAADRVADAVAREWLQRGALGR